ncbi:serine/threonine protein kinase [Lottiidibacillus patelloidae]|nr:serine/threonine protein kinase [Lottiidibacillus patelloidae]
MFKKGSDKVCSNCGWEEGTMPESPQHLVPGTVLQEKYIVGRVLGQGGFGITYLGWDLHLDMKLAIKEYMPKDFATRSAGEEEVTFYTGYVKSQFNSGMDKFLEEAKIIAKYNNHPGIVSVRDFFKANGTAYLVMYYLEGVDLKNYLSQFGGKLPFDQALAIMTPVMDALATVHKDGILHRDISPDNIYITMQGEVKLLDFGAARHAMNNNNKSMSVILKPGYAPEEQYRSRGNQGPWTDIYGLAATFYRVLTGNVPPESLDRLEEETLQLPSRLGVKIPHHAELALQKALSVKAANRYQTMEAFQQALLSGDSHVHKTVAMQSSFTNEGQHRTVAHSEFGQQFQQTNKKKKGKLFLGVVLACFLLLFSATGAIAYYLWSDKKPVASNDIPPTNNDPDPNPAVEEPDQNDTPDKPAIDNSVQVSVPLLYNLEEQQAITILQQAGLTVGQIIYEENLITKSGRVFSQSIEPEQKLGKNSPVDLYVNKGVELPVDVNTIYTEQMNIINQYSNDGITLANQGQSEAALRKYIQAREMAKILYHYNGSIDARIAEGYLANLMAAVKADLNFTYYSLEDSVDSVTIFEELINRNGYDDNEILSEVYGNLSWYQLLNNLPKDSISSSEKAYQYDVTNKIVQLNLAHGFLLTDQFKSAFSWYRYLKDFDYNGQRMSDVIADDFITLKEAGYTHPDIDVIDQIVLGNIADKSDEAEIERTIYFLMLAELAEDFDGCMSTFSLQAGSKQYNSIFDYYKGIFEAYEFSEVVVNSITIDEINGNEARATVSKSFKYKDANQSYDETVSFSFTFIKTYESLPWKMTGFQVVQ